MTWTPFLLIGPRCLTDVSILAPFLARPTTASPARRDSLAGRLGVSTSVNTPKKFKPKLRDRLYSFVVDRQIQAGGSIAEPTQSSRRP